MHVPASSVCMGLTHACPSEFVIWSAKGKGNTSVSLNLDSLTYQISGLEPYTVYNVSIAAVTGGGASNFSSPEQGQTFTSRKQPICELPSRTVGTPTYKCAQFWSWCICSEFRSFKDEQYMLYQIDSSSCLGTRLCPMLTLTRPYTYGVCKIAVSVMPLPSLPSPSLPPFPFPPSLCLLPPSRYLSTRRPAQLVSARRSCVPRCRSLTWLAQSGPLSPPTEV